MVSYYHYQKSRRQKPYNGSLSDFIRDSRYGLRACVSHYVSWKPYITVLVSYESLKNNTLSEFEKILHSMPIMVGHDTAELAVERSSFQKTRSTQEETGLTHARYYRPGFQFARRGTIGQWIEDFSPQDVIFFCKVCEEYQFYEYS